MPRPYKLKNGPFIGWMAVILSFAMITLYMPGMPSALVWPYEWAIVIGWTVLGVVFYAWAKMLERSEAADVAEAASN